MTVSNRKVDGWIEDLCGALCDPIIVYPAGGWEHDLPENLEKQIPLERLIMNMVVSKEGKGVPVGDCEALLYMYPRTMEAPMTDQQMRLYMYCFNKAMAFMKVEVPEDLKERYPLSDYDMHQLDDLKRFIWDKRVQHRKEKRRALKEEEKETKELEIKSAQPSFF